LLLVCCIVLTTAISCVHRPFGDDYYFQAMGADQEVVVTMDLSDPHRLPAPLPASFTALLSRVNRVSVALYDPKGYSDETEVLTAQDLAAYEYYGALEGNIPAFLTNSMLLWDDQWQKIEEDTVRYYRNETLGLDVYAPTRGLLLFASDNYLQAYQKTWKDRVTRIPKSLADRMANSLFGFYIASPQAMIDVGIALPKTAIMQSASLLFVIEEQHDGQLTLGGIITMKSEKLANSLSILLKSSYISDKRRKGEPLGDLTDLFVREDDAVYIQGMELSQSQFDQFSRLFGSLVSLPAGE